MIITAPVCVLFAALNALSAALHPGWGVLFWLHVAAGGLFALSAVAQVIVRSRS